VQGRYIFLNEKWKPLYKVGFLEPGNQDGKFFSMCLQVICTTGSPLTGRYSGR
jgi:hypothetical protein